MNERSLFLAFVGLVATQFMFSSPCFAGKSEASSQASTENASQAIHESSSQAGRQNSNQATSESSSHASRQSSSQAPNTQSAKQGSSTGQARNPAGSRQKTAP